MHSYSERSERKENIPLLCYDFIRYNNRFAASIKAVAPGAMETIFNYSWPGNVRELENVMQWGVVLTSSEMIEREHLPAHLGTMDRRFDANVQVMDELSLKVAQKTMEEKLIAQAMRRFQGNTSQAARDLQISYPSMLSKLKEYGVE
ncbi:AAA-type ATPase lid domain-containing protein [Desulfocastanea catecholica]